MAGSEQQSLSGYAGFHDSRPVADQLAARQRRIAIGAQIGVPSYAFGCRHLQQSRQSNLRRARESKGYRPHLRAAATSAVTSRDGQRPTADVCASYAAEMESWETLLKLKSLYEKLVSDAAKERKRRVQLQQLQPRLRGAVIAWEGDSSGAERSLAAFRERLEIFVLGVDVHDMAAKLLAAGRSRGGGGGGGGGGGPASGSPLSALDSVFVVLDHQPASATSITSPAAAVAAGAAAWDAALPARVLELFCLLMDLALTSRKPEMRSGDGDGSGSGRRLNQASGEARQRKLREQAVVLLDAFIRYCGGPALLYSELEALAALLYHVQSPITAADLKSLAASLAPGGPSAPSSSFPAAGAGAPAPPAMAVLTSAGLLARVARRAALMSTPPLMSKLSHLGGGLTMMSRTDEGAAPPPYLLTFLGNFIGRALAVVSAGGRVRPHDGRARQLSALAKALEEELEAWRRKLRLTREGEAFGAAGEDRRCGRRNQLGRRQAVKKQGVKQQQGDSDGDEEEGGSGSDGDGGGGSKGVIEAIRSMELRRTLHMAARELAEALPELVQRTWDAAARGGGGGGSDDDGDGLGGDGGERDGGGGGGGRGLTDELSDRRRLVKLLLDVERGRSRLLELAASGNAASYAIAIAAGLGILGKKTKMALERVQEDSGRGGIGSSGAGCSSAAAGGDVDVDEAAALLEGRGGAVSEPMLLGPVIFQVHPEEQQPQPRQDVPAGPSTTASTSAGAFAFAELDADGGGVVHLELIPGSPRLWDRCRMTYHCQLGDGVRIFGDELERDISWSVTMEDLQRRLDSGYGAVVRLVPGRTGLVPGRTSQMGVALRILAKLRSQMLSRRRDFLVVPLLPAIRGLPPDRSDLLSLWENRLTSCLLVEAAAGRAAAAPALVQGADERGGGAGTRAGGEAAGGGRGGAAAAAGAGSFSRSSGERPAERVAAAAAVVAGEERPTKPSPGGDDGGASAAAEPPPLGDPADPSSHTRSGSRTPSRASSGNLSEVSSLSSVSTVPYCNRNDNETDNNDDSSRDSDDDSIAGFNPANPTERSGKAAAGGGGGRVFRLAPHWRRRRALTINQALCHWTGLVGTDGGERRWMLDPPLPEDLGAAANDNAEEAKPKPTLAALLNPTGGSAGSAGMQQMVAQRMLLVLLECRPGRPDLLAGPRQASSGR